MGLLTRSSSSLTISLASMSASSGLTVGRISTAYDNSTNLDPILNVAGVVRTNASNLQVGTIEVWAIAERADGAWPECFTSTYSGSDMIGTVTSREALRAAAALVASIVTDAAQRSWAFKPVDVSLLLGGACRKFAIFVTHNAQTTTNTLDSTGHDISVKPFYWA